MTAIWNVFKNLIKIIFRWHFSDILNALSDYALDLTTRLKERESHDFQCIKNVRNLKYLRAGPGWTQKMCHLMNWFTRKLIKFPLYILFFRNHPDVFQVIWMENEKEHLLQHYKSKQRIFVVSPGQNWGAHQTIHMIIGVNGAC